ncbi:hypothetical protein GCM10025866_26720 [Naasia aerilata]|uniref:AAA+ ATPase domain-containing protein n=2 Tax=Naasia aerilata TaxID=1162966 RepID=A0ABM8GEM9_9MICO|nr:hypothetical protein GCM10025866_26720 [Naasia aerilata]
MRPVHPRTGPLHPVPGTPAAALLDELVTSPRGRIAVGIAGPGGSGKTALLEQVASRYRAAGIPVLRDAPERPPLGPAALVIDDAHAAPVAALERLTALLAEPRLDLVVAHRMWPHRPELRRLTAALEEHHPPVVLGPLTHQELATHAAAVTGSPPPVVTVEAIRQLTGGLPWLVHRVLAAAPRGRALPDVLASRELIEQLGGELEGLDEGVHELLVALAVGFDLSGTLPPSLQGAGDVDALVLEARAAGLLLADESVPPLLRDAVLGGTPAHHVHLLQRVLLDSYVDEGRPLEPIAAGLAHAGLRDRRVAQALAHRGDALLPAAPAEAATAYREAIAAGADPLALAARRAQGAWAAGDGQTAWTLLDELLAEEDPPDLPRAVATAVALWEGRGMLARAAETCRWLGAERAGPAAPLAVVAMLAAGDRAGAERMSAVPAEARSPGRAAVAAALMAEGMLGTIEGEAGALAALVRASDMLTASNQVVPLPELPAVLAALVAISSGDLAVAESVLASALAGGQGGEAARPRLLLLRAWVAMQADRPERAREAMGAAVAAPRALTPRDELLLRALEVGLARRTDDVPALVRAWQRARESVLHLPVDLYSLLPVGELAVAAARLRDTQRLAPQLDEAWRILDRLGSPPLWAVPLHWSAVQAAILADRPADLAPHASALLRAAEHNRPAAVLAAAGRAWVSVLAGDFEAAAVEKAARGLATVGLTWDGSRLASHAAAHAEERRDMTRLLACARDLHASQSAGAPLPVAPIRQRVRSGSGRRARDRTRGSAPASGRWPASCSTARTTARSGRRSSSLPAPWSTTSPGSASASTRPRGRTSSRSSGWRSTRTIRSRRGSEAPFPLTRGARYPAPRAPAQGAERRCSRPQPPPSVSVVDHRIGFPRPTPRYPRRCPPPPQGAPLMSITALLLEFLMNLLRDPAAASAFLHDPEGALDSAGLGGVCTDDVDAVMPVILDMAPVAAISGSVLGTGGNSVDGGDAHNSGPGGAVEGTGGDSLPRPSRHSPPSSTTSPTRTWTTGTR